MTRLLILVACVGVLLWLTWKWQPIAIRADLDALERRVEMLEDEA